jgi:hypothetical protein
MVTNIKLGLLPPTGWPRPRTHSRSAQYCICPHPGELARRVMSTHPRPVNADSTAGERRVIENGGVAQRVRDLRPGLVSDNRSPRPIRPPTARRRIDIRAR